ncbi:MAG TPA: hypothetical protein PLW93_04640, partial [Candidatus Absconditabacterales bacterium]|nr:hypothetical protein [Candidatus Absconditabacterales bacterium]
NKPYSELEYHAITQKLIIQSGDSYRSINHILCACNIFSSQECMGNAIKNSYKSLFIFDSYDSSKCKSSTHIRGGTNVYDCDIAGSNDSFNLFEGHTVIGSNHIFGNLIRGGDSNIYCDYLLGVCNNLFGCIGLRNKSYCIFNKQYTKEEYEKQVAKIIAHMQSTGERGEFFHPSLSPFGYNETVAQEYFPLQSITDSSEGLELTDPLNNSVNFGTFGYHRSTYSSDPIIPEGVKAIDCRGTEWAPESEGWKQLNETTLDPSATNYDICKQIIVCEVSGRPFMLQKAEIDFYRKHHIPLPRKHPDIRHEERMKLRPGRTLFLRNCDCCGKEMLSVYPQDHEGKVYCEECYQKEVYG